MARLPRPDFAGIPQHVVQRGNKRLPYFLDDDDRRKNGVRFIYSITDDFAGRCAGLTPAN